MSESDYNPCDFVILFLSQTGDMLIKNEESLKGKVKVMDHMPK